MLTIYKTENYWEKEEVEAEKILFQIAIFLQFFEDIYVPRDTGAPQPLSV